MRRQDATRSEQAQGTRGQTSEQTSGQTSGETSGETRSESASASKETSEVGHCHGLFPNQTTQMQAHTHTNTQTHPHTHTQTQAGDACQLTTVGVKEPPKLVVFGFSVH